MSAWEENETAILIGAAKESEGRVAWDDVDSLVEALPGKSKRQVTAKLVSLDKMGELEYIRKAKGKKPRGEDGKPVTKATIVAEIAETIEAGDALSGLDKAPLRALVTLRDALTTPAE